MQQEIREKKRFGKYFHKTFIAVFTILLSINISYASEMECELLDSIPVEFTDTVANINEYTTMIDSDFIVQEDILYGEAKGFYTSKNVEQPLEPKLGALLKEVNDVLKKTLKRKDGLPLYMDIYRPKNEENTVRPVMLFVHGGGFFFGDKRNKLQMELTESLIQGGFAVASINYRLGAKLWRFDDIKKAIYCSVQDTRAALRYLTHHAEELKIDPEQIYLSGSSSGAIVALTTAFMDEDEVFECCMGKKFMKKVGKLNESGNSLTCDFKIAGVISLWGSVTDLGMIETRNNVPTLLFHGTDDDILYNDSGIPFRDHLNSYMKKVFFKSEELYGSYAIYKHMKESDMNVKYIPFDGCRHAPHEEKDGSFNANINIVKNEINDFLYQNMLVYFSETNLSPL